MAGTDMVRQRQPGISVVVADEAAFIAETQLDEAGVTDDDTLEAQ